MFGITNPKMFDDALKTMEKLNLDYFELFFRFPELFRVKTFPALFPLGISEP
jgi:hypothetical protein